MFKVSSHADSVQYIAVLTIWMIIEATSWTDASKACVFYFNRTEEFSFVSESL
jgi:hypothetical protein